MRRTPHVRTAIIALAAVLAVPRPPRISMSRPSARRVAEDAQGPRPRRPVRGRRRERDDRPGRGLRREVASRPASPWPRTRCSPSARSPSNSPRPASCSWPRTAGSPSRTRSPSIIPGLTRAGDDHPARPDEPRLGLSRLLSARLRRPAHGPGHRPATRSSAASGRGRSISSRARDTPIRTPATSSWAGSSRRSAASRTGRS